MSMPTLMPLASMLAASKLYPGASLAFPGSQEKNLRNFFLNSTFYLLNITKVRNIDIDAIKRLILVGHPAERPYRRLRTVGRS